jgi:hypothetical protein
MKYSLGCQSEAKVTWIACIDGSIDAASSSPRLSALFEQSRDAGTSASGWCKGFIRPAGQTYGLKGPLSWGE